jgi:hypothetical protein
MSAESTSPDCGESFLHVHHCEGCGKWRCERCQEKHNSHSSCSIISAAEKLQKAARAVCMEAHMSIERIPNSLHRTIYELGIAHDAFLDARG